MIITLQNCDGSALFNIKKRTQTGKDKLLTIISLV